MLKTKSFTFDQDEEINQLLEKTRLAAGASIFVSDGMLLVPYEDGEPTNNSQRSIDVKVQINEMENQKIVLRHSIRVVEEMTKQMTEKLGTAEADLAEVTTKPNSKGQKEQIKTMTGIVAHINDQLRENDKAIRQNSYEIDRLDMNIKLYGEYLLELA